MTWRNDSAATYNSLKIGVKGLEQSSITIKWKNLGPILPNFQ